MTFNMNPGRDRGGDQGRDQGGNEGRRKCVRRGRFLAITVGLNLGTDHKNLIGKLRRDLIESLHGPHATHVVRRRVASRNDPRDTLLEVGRPAPRCFPSLLLKNSACEPLSSRASVPTLRTRGGGSI